MFGRPWGVNSSVGGQSTECSAPHSDGACSGDVQLKGGGPEVQVGVATWSDRYKGGKVVDGFPSQEKYFVCSWVCDRELLQDRRDVLDGLCFSDMLLFMSSFLRSTKTKGVTQSRQEVTRLQTSSAM